MTHDFICPNCGGKFERLEKTLRCENGHCFDLAKQGYVNLLPGGRLPGHVHGDNREMVRARRDFLNAGHYAPLAEALSRIFAEAVPKDGCILDCGCGEGFYSSYIAHALEDKGIDVLASDISKEAVACAAKRGNIRCAVANSFRLPVESESCDAVLCLCAPAAGEEFTRVLKKGGHIVGVYPAARHLWQMKSAVYETPYENEPSFPVPEGFVMISVNEVRFPVHLSSQKEIADLFSMTPYAYNTGEKDKARLASLESLDDEAVFTVFVCRKA